MTSETVNNISNFNHKVNKLQQSSLYKRLMQYPTCWFETTDKEEIDLAYELETYGLVNVNPNTHNNDVSVKVKITHS